MDDTEFAVALTQGRAIAGAAEVSHAPAVSSGRSPLRVVLGCAAYPPFGRGGGPVASALIARGLSAQGADVHVLVVSNENSTSHEDGVEVRTLKSLNIYSNWFASHALWKKAIWHTLENFNPRAFIRVRKELKKLRPDVYLTISIENINVASWIAARSLGIPCVHVIHSYFLMCWRGSMFRDGADCNRCKSCLASSIGKKFFSRAVNAIIAETEFPIQVHQKAGYFTKARTCVLPSAIEKATRPTESRGANFRVGYLGTHTPGKGIETLADAARRLSARGDITFLIGGRGDDSYTEELKRRFPTENTLFLGWVSPEDFFTKVDVIVVPSIWREPFGRVSVEGSAFGVPALVARSGGLPENVSDGEDGFVFEPHDHVMLADRLGQLADDEKLYQHLSDVARRRADRYDSSSLDPRMLRFLAEVASSSAKSLA